MRRLAALGVVAAGAVLAGCSAGPPVTQVRDVGGYTRVDAKGSLLLEIHLVNRADEGVRVTAGEKAIDRVHTEVRDGTLHVTTKSRGLVIGPDPLGDVSVRLAIPVLTAVTVEGSSKVDISGVSAKSLALRIAGSGDIEARGRVDRLNAEISGSADADLADLTARRAHVHVRGSGESELHVSDVLDIEVEGSADVTYRGRPRVSSRVRGSGDLRQREP